MFIADKKFTLTILVLAGIGLTLFATFGLTYFPIDLSNPAILMFGGLLLAVIVFQPSAGVLFLLATTWLSPLFKYSGGFTPNRMIGVLILGGWLVSQVFPAKRRAIKIGKYDLLFGIYFIVILLSVLIGTWYPRTQGRMFQLMIGYIIFFLIRNTIDNWKKLRWALWVIVLVSVIIAASVVIGLSSPEVETVKRLEGVEGVNTTGVFSAVAVIITLYLADSSKSRFRFLYYLLIPLFTMAIFLSGNRSGFLAFIVALLFIFAFSQSKSKIFKVLLILSILLGTFYFVKLLAPRTVLRTLDIPLQQLFLDTSEITDISQVDKRIFLNQAAWAIFLDHPILGVGYGGYSELLQLYSPLGSSYSVTHNIFLNTLAEMGVIGFLTLLSIYVVIMHDLWRAKLNQSFKNTIIIDYMLSLMLGLNILNASLHSSVITREMFIIFALSLVAKDLVNSPDNTSEISPNDRNTKNYVGSGRANS